MALEECLLLKLAGSEITCRFHRDIGFSPFSSGARFTDGATDPGYQRTIEPDPALQDPDELGEDALDVVYQAGTRSIKSCTMYRKGFINGGKARYALPLHEKSAQN
ncbi:hypothetical protein MASR2M15_29400 [Anaerolineales bacterium]